MIIRSARLLAGLVIAVAAPIAAQTSFAGAATPGGPSPDPAPATGSPIPQLTGSPVPRPTGSPVPPPTGSPVPPPTGSPVPAPTGSVLPQPTNGMPLPASLGPGSGPAPQQYAAFVHKTERQSGLIDTIKKDDDYFFDLGPQQFDHPFIVAPVLASGVGKSAFAGRIYPTFVMEFKRVGRRVMWIQKNQDFAAPPNSTAANALAISVTDSVINSTPIVAEDETAKRVVISAAFFATDFENVGKDLGGGGGPVILLGLSVKPGFSIDGTKSYVERTKALPKNDEILANLAFAGPAGSIGAAPDGRGVQIRMHYSIVEPPSSNYVPRLADDRVGYFVTRYKRFDDDNLPSPVVRYIDRWNFNDGPIVYYLTNEIPARYKPAIRSALLSWNAAFAKVGIPNAIEVRDQPSDPAWDPDDVRFSTVRWITSDSSLFSAYGPHIADPRTGQIVRVEIVIDGESLRAVKRGYLDRVAPSRSTAFDSSGLPQATAPDVHCPDTSQCDTFAEDSAESAALGTTMLRESGASEAQMQRFADDWLHGVVLHESGHNFGLRHNFAASTIYPYASLHQKNFTRTHGIVGSVMEYTPTNLAPKGESRGAYFQSSLGPYDYWAIRYGYARFPGVHVPADESSALRRIADESSRPQYVYATDEDANGPLAIDPGVATFDLSNDPLAYDADQFKLVRQLIDKLDRSYPRNDHPYAEERASFESMLRVSSRASLLAAKYVGGFYTSRDHRGQPGAIAPLRVISRAQSRRAFDLLAQNVFSSSAMRFRPELLAQLAANHFVDRDDVERPDFPVSETVADLQDAVMYQLFSPGVMSRIANAPFDAQPNRRPMKLENLFGWMQAATFDDVRPGAKTIDPIHRALQRRYARLLVAFSLAPSFVVEALGYPSDTASLASHELRDLDRRLVASLRNASLDTATRAHLEDLRSRVRHTLEASSTRGA